MVSNDSTFRSECPIKLIGLGRIISFICRPIF